MDSETKLNLLDLYFHALRELKVLETYSHMSMKQEKELKEIRLLIENLEIIFGDEMVVDSIP